MLIYLFVLLVLFILALAYYHGVWTKVLTKNSEFHAALLFFKNVQQPYFTINKAFTKIMKQVSSIPTLKKLLSEGKLKCFGSFYDNPNRVRDQSQLRSSIGVFISQEDYKALGSEK